MWVARVKGQISNAKLIVQVQQVALELLEGMCNRILRNYPTYLLFQVIAVF